MRRRTAGAAHLERTLEGVRWPIGYRTHFRHRFPAVVRMPRGPERATRRVRRVRRLAQAAAVRSQS